MTEVHSCSYYCDRPECVKAQRDELRDRLAQPEQKPYAWMAVGGTIWRHKATEDDTPIYTHPPASKPLTDDEIEAALLSVDPMTKRLPPGMKAFARAIEAAHGIKEKT